MDVSRHSNPRRAAHFRIAELGSADLPCRSAAFHSRQEPQTQTTGLRYTLWMAAVLLIGAAGVRCSGAQHSEVPAINGNLGPCTADFTVTDSSNKAVYNAKIHVTILYGFMNKRKSDLEIGTNSDGKARFEGLPYKVKKPPLEFNVRSGDLSKSVPHDPAVDCHPRFTVVLEKP
jgi:hypothetical protein